MARNVHDAGVSFGEVALVGRRRELDALRGARLGAAAGRPSAWVVAGEAGVGKTRLVSAFLERYDDRAPGVVVRARFVDLGDVGLPNLVLLDVARQLRAVPELAAAIEREPLLVDLLDQGYRLTPADPVERLQLCAAAASLLAEAGRLVGPVVLVVEDVQWIDAASADFLHFLVGRFGDERLVVALTARTHVLANKPRARRLLADLGRLPGVRRLDLEPLDEGEVADLVAAETGVPLEAATVAEVHRRTGGNPLFVRALAPLVASGGSVDKVPDELQDLLLGRLDALPDDARRVAACASVSPAAVPHGLVETVAGLDAAATEDAVRAVVAEGLLMPDGDGYRWSHELIRTAIYDSLLPGERIRLHASFADALTARAADHGAAEIAHHCASAGLRDESREWSVRAAREAMLVLSPEESFGHWARALVAGDLSAAELTEAARAARMAGQPVRAEEWARRAIRLADQAGDPADRVAARSELVHQLLPREDREALQVAEETIGLVDGLPPAVVAEAEVLLARSLQGARRTAETAAQAQRALAAARAAKLPGLEVEALTTAAFATEIDGDLQAAIGLLDDALELAGGAGEVVGELRAELMLAEMRFYNGDVAASLPVLERGLARTTSSGLRWSDRAIELRLLAVVARYTAGDLAGAAEVAHVPPGLAPEVAEARLIAVSCYPAVAMGRADELIAQVAESWGLHPHIAFVAGGCAADHLTWQGSPAAAAAMAERAQQHLDATAGEGMYGGLWLSALGLAALADLATEARLRRDDAAAAEAVAQGEVLAGRVDGIAAGGQGRPGHLGPEGRAWLARARAELSRLRGVPDVAAWEAALDAFGYGHRYEQARCRWRLADALLAGGDRDRAREQAEIAAAEAAAMGARPLQRAVAATIARGGWGAESGDGVLTARERDVLLLVAEGLSNREIGLRLFISAKTVSVHLSNAMTKLNAASRTEAVTVAHRRGLIAID